MTVVEKYIEIFTKEAIARCVLKKREAREQDQGPDDDFLEVADIEKIVAQLLLDF